MSNLPSNLERDMSFTLNSNPVAGRLAVWPGSVRARHFRVCL